MSNTKIDHGSQVTSPPPSATEKFYHRDGPRRRRELLMTTGPIKAPHPPSLLASSRALQHSTSFGKNSVRSKKQPTQIAPIMHNIDSFEKLRMATQAYTHLGSSGYGTTTNSSSTATPRSTVSSRGQQFTVASVGNNGMLYLRPVTRPQPGPFVILPSTPPKTAEDQDDDPDSKKGDSSTDSKSTEDPKTPPETPRRIAASQEPPSSPPIPRINHSRARSWSTIGEMSAPQDVQQGSVKVTIEKPEPPRRPRTAGPNQSHPHLEVTIPHYSLGSPGFSPSGTPYLFGSSLAANSMLATKGATSAWSQTTEFNWVFPSADNKRDGGYQSQHLHPPAPTSRLSLMSTPLASGIISPVVASAPIMMCGQQPISPNIYDTLSFPPGSDHPSTVRHDPRTNDIIAATPSRIIAQITSATFLDYQLLSDFFLTFRAFLTPSDLVSHLLVRLQWAIDRDDDVGKVVRVRTFVAIRHWLLNYFADDFVPSLDLREQFCNALNELSHDVRGRHNTNQSDMKIIGELKKCWRRTCALYWDGAPGGGLDVVNAGAEVDIMPGGSAGSRDDPKVLAELFDEDFKGKNAKPALKKKPERLGKVPIDNITSGATERFIREVISSGGKSAGSPNKRKQKKAKKAKENEASRSRGKGKNREDPNGGKSSSLPSFKSKGPEDQYYESGERSGEARMPNGPRATPHKRSGSFSDALRDDRQPLSMKKQTTKPIQLFIPFAGSLVRGNLIPPTPAVVEVIAPSTPTEKVLLGPNVPAHGRGYLHHPHPKIAALRGPGVKKLLGNMKRALSGRINAIQHESSDEQGPPEELARYVASEGKQATLTGILSRSGSYGSTGPGGARTRIDLLGAGVVEAFHRALDDQIKAAKVQKDAIEAVRKAYTENQGIAIQPLGPTEPPLERAAVPDDAVSVDSGESDGEGEKNTALRPAPKGKSRHRATRSKSADLTIESVNSKRYKKNFSFGRVAMEAWAEKGVVTPSPSASLSSSVRKSFSPSYDASPSSVLKRMRNHQIVGDVSSPTAKSFMSSNEGSLFSYNSSKLLASFRSRSYGEKARRLVGGGDAQLEEEEDYFEEENDEMSTAPSSARRPPGGDPFDRPPARMLRRRPGGDLKTANTVGDLEPETRPQSGVSFGTYSESVVSVWPKVNHSLYSQTPITGVLSLGAVTLGAPVKGLNRGKSRLRYSTTNRSSGAESCASAPETFEAGVLKLADLPDNASEDGGIEVALMKLEGTYRRTNFERPIADGRRASDGILSTTTTTRDFADMDIVVKEEEVSDLEDDDDEDESSSSISDDDDNYSDLYEGFMSGSGNNLLGLQQKQKRRLVQVPQESSDHETPRASRKPKNDSEVRDLPLSFINTRNESNEFIPILERGQNADMLSIPDTADMGHSSISLRDIQKDLLGSREDGFSSNVDGNMSDVSSELSVDLMAKRKRASVSSSVLPNLTPGAIMSKLDIPSHPLRHPPSPPLTLEQAVSMSPASDRAWPLKDRSRTPEAKLEVLENLQKTPNKPTPKATKRLRKAVDSGPRFHVTAIHLPFILAYDSELLAKQFTLIEKDALTEIDWKELVELRWKQTTSPVTDWVEFLRSQESRGVEVVIARFNLMVKWAASEIVMTNSIDERVRTITKLIHIAAHARRLQNFATMYQITIALLSADVARLHKTWQLITHANMRTLRELEALVQPMRNFHNLRTEMETVTGETGCIPFVGLYTHDLIYNAQRPAQLIGTPNGPPLVNFERHRTTATIVKRLLRLIEASQKYDFVPVDGVCERCLWIAALKDDEINKLSLELEGDV